MATKTKKKKEPLAKRSKTKSISKKAGKSTSLRSNKVQGHTNTLVMTTLAVGAAGVLGYFGWQYYKKKKTASVNLDNQLLKTQTVSPVVPGIVMPADTTNTYIPPIQDTSSTSRKQKKSGYTAPISDDGFPLKKGSKGENVKKLQLALMNKYGKSILPKYGADGDFGTETVNALKKAGLSQIIDESLFNVIVQGNATSAASNAIDYTVIAKKLFSAALTRNFSTALSQLKILKSQNDYAQVNDVFRNYRLNGVRKTLVNGMLSSFTTNDQKQKIRFEFIRMGLKYDGSTWSLSGFDGKPIVTKTTTTVWAGPNESLQVPAKMVLGNEVTQRLDYALFENNQRYFLVKTATIAYL